MATSFFSVDTLRYAPLPSGFSAPVGSITPQANGFVATGTGSYGQYSGAFGYKTRLIGNLVASFQALIRFDNNGLTARFTPLYGLGYSF